MTTVFRTIQRCLRENRLAYEAIDPQLLPFIEDIKSDKTKSYLLSTEFVDQSLTMFLGDYENPEGNETVSFSDAEEKKMLERMSRCAHLLRIGYPSIFIEHPHPRMRHKGILCTQKEDHIAFALFTHLDKFQDTGVAIDRVCLPLSCSYFFPSRLNAGFHLKDTLDTVVSKSTLMKNGYYTQAKKEHVQSILTEEIGLIIPMVAILLAMVSPKVTVAVETNKTVFTGKGKHKKLSKDRVTVIDLHPKIRQSIAEGKAKREIDKHWVVGHWKVRQSGVFWWDHYQRGTGELIEREAYSIEPKQNIELKEVS